MVVNLDKYHILNKFSVSRETFSILDEFRKLIIEKNKKINIISPKTIENIIERHIIDCAQSIDFIDKNNKICTDLGSGAGLPGIVLAILVRSKNINMKINLYEKSHHKSSFLRFASKKLNLNTQIVEKDIFKQKNIVSGSVIARAFKPLPVILEVLEENFLNYTNLIVFMGKNGKQLLDNALNKWEFEYKEKESVTSCDSFLLNIKNIKKKN